LIALGSGAPLAAQGGQAAPTSAQAIIAATRIGAAVCDASNRLGTIEKGKLADLLVIDGDPLKDIRDLRKVAVIIQEGKWVKR